MTALTGPDRDRPPVTAASLRADLEARLQSRHATTDPGGAADACMSVVLPHLKALVAEIDRLRAQVVSSATTIEVLRGRQVKDSGEGEGRHGR